MTPADLHRVARAERVRRRAAWMAAGQGGTDRARADDALWSNIEQRTGRAAGDPVCLGREPSWWTPAECETMARNAWATAMKADSALDHANPAHHAQLAGLWALYRWLRPIGFNPRVEADARRRSTGATA